MFDPAGSIYRGSYINSRIEEKGETVQKGQSDMPEEKAVNTSSAGGAGAEDAAGNGSGTDVYHLPGYINGTEPDGEPIVCGVSLPFQVADTPILIEGIGQYTGSLRGRRDR